MDQADQLTLKLLSGAPLRILRLFAANFVEYSVGR
jgi:hypothetical protein